MFFSNLKLFRELQRVANQQNAFNVEKMYANSLELMNDLFELEDKGLVKLEVNRFVQKYDQFALEVQG